MSTVKGYDDMTNGQTKAVISKMGGVEVAMAFLRDEYVLTKVAAAVASVLLACVGTVLLPASKERFRAREKFWVDTSATAEVKIAYIDDYFKEWFLAGGGAVELTRLERKLRYARLNRDSTDSPVIADLGGEKAAETTLADVWELLKQQPHGEEGPLLSCGIANIFYVRDCTCSYVLRTVSVHWRGGGWRVNACSVGISDGLGASSQVFSRN